MSSKTGSQGLNVPRARASPLHTNQDVTAEDESDSDKEFVEADNGGGDTTPVAAAASPGLLANGIHLDEELTRASVEDLELTNGGANIDVDTLEESTLEESTLPQDSFAEDDQSSISGPDELPSDHNSIHTSPISSTPVSRPSSRLGSSPVHTPFDRRLQARTSSASFTARLSSPHFLTPHSRRSSFASQISLSSQTKSETDSDADIHAPWDVIRWNRLKRISSQAFSEAGRRAFGRPSFLTIGASIAIGTSKGIVLLFDYQQNLKNVIGQGTPATESGPVTCLAISADHSTVASGHANGSIFTWDLGGPAKPFLHIPAVDRSQPKQPKTDGHVLNSTVLHLGFLGQRHTALVSADSKGMAFSHLASRGLGPVGRSVKTTRILGRYLDARPTAAKNLKPSSVLAFAPLPLGNVEQATDGLGLTALLTPYLLVIVSTTPVAQTHFKTPRMKDIAPHSAMSGCLAWFPAVKLNNAPQNQTKATSNTKLVYCWSNVLSLLDITELDNREPSDPAGQPALRFTARGRWECDEAILAVQWMSRSIITVLTVTQRLVILNDYPLRQVDASDLNAKHIYHEDIFSQQLASLVDKDDYGEASMHGVVADAYHMSFKAYKGRLFLLGMNDVSMGTLSNWADRLMALMEVGNPVAAIELATSYYNGETDKVSIGLPENDEKRHALVKEKILELLSASFQYIFNDEDNRDVESDLRSVLTRLAKATFAACFSINETAFLFDEAYDWYANVSMQDIFLYELEPYINDGKIDTVPTSVLQFMLNWYSAHDFGPRLEDMLCALKTDTMDIDHVSTVCRQLHLYDALISVWNRALCDYITPLIDLMALADAATHETDNSSAGKIFPYLAYSLTGRSYPNGFDLEPDLAFRAKATLYGFIFSSKRVTWPQPYGNTVAFASLANKNTHYPYLRFLLQFDSLNFMVLLNEVFEDTFLNGGEKLSGAGTGSEDLEPLGVSGTYINRQRIVNTLLEVVKIPDFAVDDIIYLDMFLARSLPKFSQFILLSGTVLRQVLIELCINPREELREECQLSVEYLLSIYQPPDILELISMFVKARYFRIVKSTYRSRKQYAKWLEVHFEDTDDQEAVFTCIGDCLRSGSGLSNRQLIEVKQVLKEHINDLVGINVSRSATSLEIYAPELLDLALEVPETGSKEQFLFLQAIFEPLEQDREKEQESIKLFHDKHRDLYVRLMCKHDPSHVADYVSLLDSGDLHLDKVLPIMDESGVVDAAVILLTTDGFGREAIDRLKTHLARLGNVLLELLNIQEASTRIQDQLDNVLEQIQNYAKIGIWLCQQQSNPAQKKSSPKHSKKPAVESSEQDLTVPEQLWLDLIDTVVKISQEVSWVTRKVVDESSERIPNEQALVYDKETTTEKSRKIVQQVFTGLLATTTNSAAHIASPLESTSQSLPTMRPSKNSSSEYRVRFLAVLSSFMTRLASRSSSISSIRGVLQSIFSAYVFESSMLELANGLLDKDVFVHVKDAEAWRRCGWRPKGQLCERCKRRAWGTGAAGTIWEDWVTRRDQEAKKRNLMLERSSDRAPAGSTGNPDKGKAREEAQKEKPRPGSATASDESATPGDHDALVVFSCSHVFHQKCLEHIADAVSGQDGSGQATYRCPVCT